MKQTIRIRGMYCLNCEKRIAAALLKLEGVKSARVDYASGNAEIESKKALAREQLQSTLLDLGY
ncbi:MAG: heavy-metal-associated domain-containing protein, partial [Oscillospiraceae bacterium]|nr:heavy-metal-associated domain-containing protein [Oscillospiraceae bacterium]